MIPDNSSSPAPAAAAPAAAAAEFGGGRGGGPGGPGGVGAGAGAGAGTRTGTGAALLDRSDAARYAPGVCRAERVQTRGAGQIAAVMTTQPCPVRAVGAGLLANCMAYPALAGAAVVTCPAGREVQTQLAAPKCPQGGQVGGGRRSRRARSATIRRHAFRAQVRREGRERQRARVADGGSCNLGGITCSVGVTFWCFGGIYLGLVWIPHGTAGHVKSPTYRDWPGPVKTNQG